MFQIQVGSFVTLARYAGQGAFGVLAGTSCQVIDIINPTKPEMPAVLLLRPISGGQASPICVRVPAEETMEGIINTLEAQCSNLNADVLTLLQVLDAPEPVDIDLDLADDGKLDLPPRVSPGTPVPAAPARARKPMPPDPSASARPVQQPIRFELDPERVARDSDRKPRS